MLKRLGESDQHVVLTPHHERTKEVKEKHLPEQINARFIQVKLNTGKYEVLITNLMNKKHFSQSLFKHIYYMRWGIEGLYYILKSHLNLEKFTGKTVESVYLTGLELIFSLNSNKEPARKKI